jgi:hypothetical protein
VKHVPTSKKYLLSVGKAYLYGINVNILGIECYLTDSYGYHLGYAEHVFPYQWLVDLSLPDKHVSFHPETKFVEACNVQVANNNADLWHQRLGHLSPHNLMRMRKGCMVKGMKLPPTDLSKMIGNKGVCSACLKGKQSIQPFKSTGTTCTRKLEVVHMDLMGPITPPTNDDDEEASADSETTSGSLDGPVDLPAENFSENVPSVSLAPLGNEFTIPLLDKL